MNNIIIIAQNYGLSALSDQSSIHSIHSLSSIYKIGDIYCGTVDRLLPSINSAFVKLKRSNKYSSTGFIYIKDLKSIKRLRPLNDNLKIHPLYQLLVHKQKIITQVVKEMHFEKGPRVTTLIVLNGHYLKLLPLSNIIHVSTKILDIKSRNILKAVGKLIVSSSMGIIFRSNALGISPQILLREFYLLQQHWFYISKKILVGNHLSLAYREDNLISNCIRDYYLGSSKQIILDSSEALLQFKFFIKYWSCLKNEHSFNTKINLHKTNASFWNSNSLNFVLTNLFKNTIHLPYGGYLFLETINAMTFVDVNSGKFNSNDNSRNSILKVNLAAAHEIVYQIIIRNIAGIILIDFIDMKTQADKELLLEYLFNLLENDINNSSIIQYSRLGIVEITRKRAGKSFNNYSYYDNNTKTSVIDTTIFYQTSFVFDKITKSTLRK